MDSRSWILFSDKVLAALAADHEGLFADLRPEIERRLFEADPDKELRRQIANVDKRENTGTDGTSETD